MSKPSGEQRSSISPQPSQTASAASDSRSSPSVFERGESSSSAPRTSTPVRDVDPSFSGGRYNGKAVGRTDDADGREYLAVGKHRPRRSGGFLLEPTLYAAGGRRAQDRGGSTREESGRGKERLGRMDSGKDRARLSQAADGSPGSRSFTPSRTGMTGDDSPMSLGTSSHWSQPEVLSRKRVHVTPDGNFKSASGTAEASASTGNTGPSGSGAINATELVNMALNLSESRRRNLSAGHLIAQPAVSGRRVTSAGTPGVPSIPGNLHGSFRDYTPGSSLKYHLQQQRRLSRNVSPGTYKNRHSGARKSSSTSAHLIEPATALRHELNTAYQFTPATLARAKKARDYIELSLELRRLLEHLPPLRSTSEEVCSSAPGTSNIHIHRVPSSNRGEIEYGRTYNPLQSIRNRRVRARERQVLNPDVDEWEDVDKVRAWVDQVVYRVEDPDFRTVDEVVLPPYDGRSVNDRDGHAQLSLGARSGTLSLAKPKRSRMDWFTSPAEILADTFWLEQDDNKALIEDRNGQKMFPTKLLSASYKPRSSKESYRGNEIASRAAADSAGNVAQRSEATDDSDDVSDRGRRKLPFLRGTRSPSASRSRRTAWHKASKRSRSSSVSSGADGNGLRRGRHKRKDTSNYPDNIGPLELHMNEMLRKQEALEAASPMAESPDRWGYENRNQTGGSVRKQESIFSNGGRLPNGKRPVNRARKPAKLGLPFDREPRSSFEELDSTEPNSPVTHTFVPGIAVELSPPGSRTASPQRKPKLSKLLPFRLDIPGHTDADRGSLGADEDEDLALRKRDTAQSQSQDGTLEEYGGQSGSGPASPTKRVGKAHTFGSKSRRDEKAKEGRAESKSAVSRFFRGGRIGDFVRHEGSKVSDLLRKKETAEDSDSDEISDSADYVLETGSAATNGLKPKPKAVGASDDGRTNAGHRYKYSVDNLPKFRPSSPVSDRRPSSARGSGEPDRTRRRAGAYESVTPPRLNRIATSNSYISKTKSNTSPLGQVQAVINEPPDRNDRGSLSVSDPSRSSSATRDTSKRLHDVVADAGEPGRAVRETSASEDVDTAGPLNSRARSSSRPQVRRHWSITDELEAQRQSESAIAGCARGLARSRALLLSSGVKASEISRCSSVPRETLPAYLAEAFAASKSSAGPVPHRDEHAVAARILMSELDAALSSLAAASKRSLENALAPEDSGTANGSTFLRTRLADLKHLLDNTLTQRVHDCAEAADRAIEDMSGAQRIAVREVGDAVGAMIRARRRRLRWVRRLAFLLLEWLLLGVMWWVWLVVVLIRLTRGVLISVVTAVRWFLWL